MRVVLQNAFVAGLLSTVMSIDVRDCFTQFSNAGYKGCYEDSWDRVLSDAQHDFSDNSVPLCIETCGNQGYPYAGLQYTKQCFCGKEVKRWSQKGEEECDYKCNGSHEMCGGSWRISIYSTEGISTLLQEATGSTFSFPDGCNKCSCTWVNHAFQLSCETVACPQLKCDKNLQQTLPGDCCPTCKSGCYVEDIGHVNEGEEIATDDPCETCVCEENQEGGFSTVCMTMACMMECPYGYIDDGSCCGKCKECDPDECPSLSCNKKYQFQDDDMCCPQCLCSYRGEKVKPGQVGDSCDGCVCDTGVIKCDPIKCNTNLECVDPVKGDDCCYTCPNGKTCRHEKKTKIVIREGQTKVVGKTFCMCSPSFWYPYAFCAKLQVKNNAFPGIKNYKDIVAKWFNGKN